MSDPLIVNIKETRYLTKERYDIDFFINIDNKQIPYFSELDIDKDNYIFNDIKNLYDIIDKKYSFIGENDNEIFKKNFIINCLKSIS